MCYVYGARVHLSTDPVMMSWCPNMQGQQGNVQLIDVVLFLLTLLALPYCSTDVFLPPKAPITYWGANWPGGLTDPSCPGEEER